MGYAANDPRWVEAPIDTSCGRCGAPINQGAIAYFYPEKQQSLCNSMPCGHEADRLVQSQMRDTR